MPIALTSTISHNSILQQKPAPKTTGYHPCHRIQNSNTIMKVTITLPDGTLANISFSKLTLFAKNYLEEKQGFFDINRLESVLRTKGKTVVPPTEHSKYDYTREEKVRQDLAATSGYRKIVLKSNSYFNYNGASYLASADKHVIANDSFMAAMNTVPFGYTIAIAAQNAELDSISEETIRYTIYDKDGNAIPPQSNQISSHHQRTETGEINPMFLSIRTFVY